MASKIAPPQLYPGQIEGATEVPPGDKLWLPSTPATQKVLPSHFKKVTNADGVEVSAIIFRVDPPMLEKSDDYIAVGCIIGGVEIKSIPINQDNRNEGFRFYISQHQLKINTAYKINYVLRRKIGKPEKSDTLRLIYRDV